MNTLPDIILENIFQWISLKDILTCTCVCSHWQQIINREIFWKQRLHSHFDIEPSEERLESSIMKEWRDNWYQYFKDDEGECYVFDPFPVVLGCGVVAPHEFKVDSNYKNIFIALEKLKILSMRYVRNKKFNSLK